jgi:hypothetical protein
MDNKEIKDIEVNGGRYMAKGIAVIGMVTIGVMGLTALVNGLDGTTAKREIANECAKAQWAQTGERIVEVKKAQIDSAYATFKGIKNGKEEYFEMDGGKMRKVSRGKAALAAVKEQVKEQCGCKE